MITAFIRNLFNYTILSDKFSISEAPLERFGYLPSCSQAVNTQFNHISWFKIAWGIKPQSNTEWRARRDEAQAGPPAARSAPGARRRRGPHSAASRCVNFFGTARKLP